MKRRFSVAKKLDVDIMDEGDAYYEGAQENTFDNFSEEASQNTSSHGIKSVAEYNQAEGSKKKLEEHKLLDAEKIRATIRTLPPPP